MTWIIIPKNYQDSTEAWKVNETDTAEIFKGKKWESVDDKKSLTDNPASCEIVVLKRKKIKENFAFLDKLSNPCVFVHFGNGNISERYKEIKNIRTDWEALVGSLSLGEAAKCWDVIPISGGSAYGWQGEIRKFRDNRKKEDEQENLCQYLKDAWKIAWKYYNLEAPSKRLAEAAFPVAIDLQGHQNQGYSKSDLKASLDSVAEDFKEIKKQYAYACELLCRYESIYDRLNDENFKDLNVLKDDIDGFIEAFRLFSQRYTQIVLPPSADD